jgi:hypothetical protein
MKKHLLVVGIIFLLAFSSIPVTFGYIADTSDETEPTPISSGGLMNSSWPMTGHDLHHTSRSPYGNPGNYLVEKWKVQLDKPAHYGCSPVVAKDGTIYICMQLIQMGQLNGNIKYLDIILRLFLHLLLVQMEQFMLMVMKKNFMLFIQMVQLNG